MNVGKGTYGHGGIQVRGDMTKITIGKYCSIASGLILDGGFQHDVRNISTYPFHMVNPAFPNMNRSKGDIVIGNDVWIGEDVLIMSGVTIGDGAIIGARSVVTKDVRPYWVVAGNPAHHIRGRYHESTIRELLSVAWWNWDESKIHENVNLLSSPNINEFLQKHL